MAKKDFNINTAPVYETIAAAITEPEQKDTGKKNSQRFNIAVAEDLAEYVRIMSDANRMTKNDFIALAIAEHKERNAAQYAAAQEFFSKLEK